MVAHTHTHAQTLTHRQAERQHSTQRYICWLYSRNSCRGAAADSSAAIATIASKVCYLCKRRMHAQNVRFLCLSAHVVLRPLWATWKWNTVALTYSPSHPLHPLVLALSPIAAAVIVDVIPHNRCRRNCLLFSSQPTKKKKINKLRRFLVNVALCNSLQRSCMPVRIVETIKCISP